MMCRLRVLLIASALGAFALTASAETVNLSFIFDSSTYHRESSSAQYGCFPNAWGEGGDYSTWSIESANAQFIDGGTNRFFDFDAYVGELSGGDWRLFYHRGQPEEQVFTFHMDFYLTEVDLQAMEIFSPTFDERVGPMPTFHFSRMTRFDSTWLGLAGYEGWSLLPGQDSFEMPTSMTPGEYWMNLDHYGEIDGWGAITPTGDNADAFPDFSVSGEFHLGASTRFTVVPEPATLGLFALGGVALIRRRRTA